MNTPPQSEEDPVVGFLVKRFGPEAAADPGKGCLDDGAFVGLAEDRLLPGEREAVEAHLRGCEHCREIAARLPGGAMARSGRKVFRIPVPSWPGSSRAGAGGKRLELGPLAAAAVLLLAFAAGFGVSRLLRKGGSPDGLLGTEQRLVAAAGELARTRPQQFGGFSPLSKEERLATQPELRGPEPALLYPAGRIFEARPAFRWEADAAAGEEPIVLRTASGRKLWQGRGRAPILPYPAEAPDLEPGVRYVWEVGGGARRRLFAAASPAEREDFENARRGIREAAPADLRSLLTAHYALRHEFYGAAEEAGWAHLLGSEDWARPGEVSKEERERLESGLALAQQSGDRAKEAAVLADLGFAWLRLGDYAKALEQFRRHEALARELGTAPRVRVRGDPVGWETLDYVLRQLGSSQAGRLAPKAAGDSVGR